MSKREREASLNVLEKNNKKGKFDDLRIRENKSEEEKKVYIRLPCSKENQYPCPDDKEKKLHRWPVIKAALNLARNARTADALVESIEAVNPVNTNQRSNSRSNYKALEEYCTTRMTDEENKLYFEEDGIISRMADLALRIEELFPSGLPALTAGKNAAVSLTAEQVASLLCNAFFITFPQSRTTIKTRKLKWPAIAFGSIFGTNAPPNSKNNFCGKNVKIPEIGPLVDDVHAAKLDFLFAYFKEITTCGKDELNSRIITFEKRVYPESTVFPKHLLVDEAAGVDLTTVRIVDTRERIENIPNSLHVTFSTDIVGGSVLTKRDAKQVEIQYLINPECFVSRLLVEKMIDSEVLLIHGTKRFSSYTGYESRLRRTGPPPTLAPGEDAYPTIAVMDALQLTASSCRTLQFQEDSILRDIKKAYLSFVSLDGGKHYDTVATGAWGCEIFFAYPQLKFLIQWIAASMAGKKMVYCTKPSSKFSDGKFDGALFSSHSENLLKFVEIQGDSSSVLAIDETRKPVTTCEIYKYLLNVINNSDAWDDDSATSRADDLLHRIHTLCRMYR